MSGQNLPPSPLGASSPPGRKSDPANAGTRVFLVHWNRPRECLRSVQSFLGSGLPLSVAVVDNGSTADNCRALKNSLPKEVELIRSKRNLGWGGGLNLGLRRWLAEGTTAYCFVAPHDALPQGDCLERLLKCMDADATLGIVSPEPAGGGLTPTYSPIRGPRLSPLLEHGADNMEATAFPNGTLMLLRRECLRDIGLFDERYFTYGEEIEIGLRARRHGWKVAQVRGAQVTNPVCGSPRPVVHYLLSRNSLIMARVYGGRFQATVRAGLMLGNTMLMALSPTRQRRNVCTGARVRAVWDFFMGRNGPPPASLFATITHKQIDPGTQ